MTIFRWFMSYCLSGNSADVYKRQCTRFGLTSDQVIRHYDVTGKDCPKYYVENPDAWIQMKSDIAAQIQTDYALQGK